MNPLSFLLPSTALSLVLATIAALVGCSAFVVVGIYFFGGMLVALALLAIALLPNSILESRKSRPHEGKRTIEYGLDAVLRAQIDTSDLNPPLKSLCRGAMEGSQKLVKIDFPP